MHALIVVAHPDPGSLSHGLAAELAAAVATTADNTAEIADLSAEGFDPRFNAVDDAAFRGRGVPPDDVAAEQARIDRADALVLVYPVYWWSMPGILKGWIDRVFSSGWAYAEQADGRLVKLLGRLPVHLVAVAGGDARTYARHGYAGAMRIQIDHGIFDYCGARVLTSELLLDADTEPAEHLAVARRIGSSLFDPARYAGAAA